MTDEARIAQADLRKYRDAKRNAMDLKNRITQLEAQINSTTSHLKDICIQSTSRSKDERIAILADLRDEYFGQQKRSEETCMNIAVKIGEMQNDFYKLILRNRYLYNQTFEAITANEQLKSDNPISYRQIKRIHQKALNQYAVVLKRVDIAEYNLLWDYEIRRGE